MKFNPNDKEFGNQILDFIFGSLSKRAGINSKKGWINKNDTLPLITIIKSMDEVQKLYETKIITLTINVWCKNEGSRKFISDKIDNFLKEIIVDSSKIEINGPTVLNFENKGGIFRTNYSIVIRAKVNVNKRELEALKNMAERAEKLSKILFGDFGIGGEIIEPKNKQYCLFKPTGHTTLALVKKDKIIWKKEFDNIISFDFAKNASYSIAVAQLTKKEMPKEYKSGGHIYLIDLKGKIKDIKIPCDGLSCSISPDSKHFGVTTMGPEWGVYYFDNKGNNLWKARFDKRVGGIELTKNQLILYDKMHKETRKEVFRLDKTGKII